MEFMSKPPVEQTRPGAAAVDRGINAAEKINRTETRRLPQIEYDMTLASDKG